MGVMGLNGVNGVNGVDGFNGGIITYYILLTIYKQQTDRKKRHDERINSHNATVDGDDGYGDVAAGAELIQG